MACGRHRAALVVRAAEAVKLTHASSEKNRSTKNMFAVDDSWGDDAAPEDPAPAPLAGGDGAGKRAKLVFTIK